MTDPAAAPTASWDGPRDSADPSPITWMLGAATSCIVLSLLSIAIDSHALDIGAYILACPVAFTIVALYRREAERRLSELGIGVGAFAMRASVILLAVGFAVSIAHAYSIAEFYA